MPAARVPVRRQTPVGRGDADDHAARAPAGAVERSGAEFQVSLRLACLMRGASVASVMRWRGNAVGLTVLRMPRAAEHRRRLRDLLAADQDDSAPAVRRHVSVLVRRLGRLLRLPACNPLRSVHAQRCNHQGAVEPLPGSRGRAAWAEHLP
eukprot:395296-Rhodomonas_salina.4